MYRKHLKYIEGLQEQAETPHIANRHRCNNANRVGA